MKFLQRYANIAKKRVPDENAAARDSRHKYVAWRQDKKLQGVINWYFMRVQKAESVKDAACAAFLIQDAKEGLSMFVQSDLKGPVAEKRDFINCIIHSRNDRVFAG
ncbi:MAG: hypothetical protein FWE64_01935 [Alphaproteobacteria bacterium]|nr:hypothetical protein [Alphaproteobacteria bacterium]